MVLANYKQLDLSKLPKWNATDCTFPILEAMEMLYSSNITKSSPTIAANDLTNYANDVWLMIVTMTTGKLKII